MVMMGGGAPMFGGRGSPGNPGGGLPFAGIPSELQDGVDRLLTTEPEHPEPAATYTYGKAGDGAQKLSLRSLLLEHWQLGVWAVVLVAIVSVFNQAGPTLIGIGINRGLGPHKDFTVIVVVSIVYLVCVAITAAAQRFMTEVTGRLAVWVMNDLRVKVFTHLQRLSLDFYTEEKEARLSLKAEPQLARQLVSESNSSVGASLVWLLANSDGLTR